MQELKQTIIIRKDLNLPKGKLAAQAAHASIEAFIKANETNQKKWLQQGQKKVVLKVENEKELILIFQKAKDNQLPTSLITDAGKTVVAPGTKTAVGIGPDTEENIDLICKDLKML